MKKFLLSSMLVILLHFTGYTEMKEYVYYTQKFQDIMAHKVDIVFTNPNMIKLINNEEFTHYVYIAYNNDDKYIAFIPNSFLHQDKALSLDRQKQFLESSIQKRIHFKVDYQKDSEEVNTPPQANPETGYTQTQTFRLIHITPDAYFDKQHHIQNNMEKDYVELNN